MMRSAALCTGFILAGSLAGPLSSQTPAPNLGPALLMGGGLRIRADKGKAAHVLAGDVSAGGLGDMRLENSGHGIHLRSAAGAPDRAGAGTATWTVEGVQAHADRWFRVRIRGLAQEDFRVDKDELFLRVEFLKDGGTKSIDHITKNIYPQVETDRVRLADPSMKSKFSKETWRNYGFEFRTPLAEVDTLRVSVGFANGNGKGERAEFWVGELEIVPIPVPADFVRPNIPAKDPPALKSLVKLGGRWYYDPRGKGKEPPKQFDHTNADRLYYHAGRLENPFAGNTSAWLRKGYQDPAGKLVAEDKFVPDNVIITFTDKHLVMKTHNLPNHPTAVFPDRTRFTDGNPNFIQEKIDTWYIPLEPKVNDKHLAMNEKNANRALPLGPIGVAVNGINFLYPFDETTERDALWRLDRCCGHPSPGQRYHYHKYPVCLNTPWFDDGQAHSPLIGFAFDGFPVYGPYEGAGEFARDSKKNPLNAFNLHHDEERGWHYHVTPGQFPHIIGGFWGEIEPLNRVGKNKGPAPKKKKLD